MYVQVVNLLPTFSARVADDPESTFRIRLAALLQRQPGSKSHHVSHQANVFLADLCQGGYVVFGNQHEMHRSPGMDVMKRENRIVLVHVARRYLTPHDFAEHAIRIMRHDVQPQLPDRPTVVHCNHTLDDTVQEPE